MDEKLLLQWNGFQDNAKTAFGNLRNTSDFVDVTLACEDDNSNLLRLFLLFMLMMRNVLTTVWCRCGR